MDSWPIRPSRDPSELDAACSPCSSWIGVAETSTSCGRDTRVPGHPTPPRRPPHRQSLASPGPTGGGSRSLQERTKPTNEERTECRLTGRKRRTRSRRGLARLGQSWPRSSRSTCPQGRAATAQRRVAAGMTRNPSPAEEVAEPNRRGEKSLGATAP